MFYAQLIAVGLADAAVLICPGIPDVAVQVVDIVRLLLPDPEDLISGGLPRSAAKRHHWKLPAQIIAVHHTELLDRVGRCSVLPVRANGEVGVPGSVLQNVFAVFYKNLIGITHR